jgi:cytidylate kinase
MAINIKGEKFVPGTYVKARPSAAQMAEQYIGEWEEKRLKKKDEKTLMKMPPSICFSRKIGVGALEIADILAEEIGYRVVDREILEIISQQAELSEKTVTVFDERYPGKMSEFLYLVFGEKAFIKTDYAKQLFRAVYAISALQPTIFVGRGAHLLLPRDRLLAVRLICSRENRVKRLAGVLKADEAEIDSQMEQIDKEQADFFKKVYGKKDASAYEFDLVINCDYLREPGWAASITREAFVQRFGPESVLS